MCIRDSFHVVCRIENVYFSSGQYSRRFLKGEGCREEAATYCLSLIHIFYDGRAFRKEPDDSDILVCKECGSRQLEIQVWINALSLIHISHNTP